MTPGEKGEPAGETRRLKRQAGNSPVSVSPTTRLDSMTQGRIEALELDKKDLRVENARLQARIDQLGPENARLEVVLANAESNDVVATILLVVGGFLVSYATFTGKAAEKWANVAAGSLLAGIGLMIWQSIRRWRKS